MKLVIIGADGQLGYDYLEYATRNNHTCIGLSHKQIDISNFENVYEVLSPLDFELIINTAAYHGYSAYKDTNPLKYFNTNVFGPAYLAKFASENNKVMIHFSTDYVFSGNILQKGQAFSENDFPTPNNLYSLSKYSGELIIPIYTDKYFIFRIASIYGKKGCKAKNSSNFVDMILSKLEKGESIEVVGDIYMSPTSTSSIVSKSFEVIQSNKFGLYHLAGSGYCSWYEFALEIAKLGGYSEEKIVKTTSENLIQEIKRGKNTALLNNNLIKNRFSNLNNWKFYLNEYLGNKYFNRTNK